MEGGEGEQELHTRAEGYETFGQCSQQHLLHGAGGALVLVSGKKKGGKMAFWGSEDKRGALKYRCPPAANHALKGSSSPGNIARHQAIEVKRNGELELFRELFANKFSKQDYCGVTDTCLSRLVLFMA